MRRILRLDSGVPSVAREAPFDSESQLHRAIAGHPEVLPAEDVGLGPLVVLANELDLGAGPMDLLAVDAQGRLVIVEFKRGSENPDVRKVIAQVLDYGSSLWRHPYDELERKCQVCSPGFEVSLGEHVEDGLRKLGENYEEETFRTGLGRCLEAGSFVFMYVGRDLDARTKRIMTFLAEGARMTFFAVEVDHFHAGDAHSSVMVPRTAFVPSWVQAPVVSQVSPAPVVPSDETRLLTEKMDGLAQELGLSIDERRTGRVYLPQALEPVQYAASGIGVYATQRGLEMNLSVFRQYGEDDIAEGLLDALGSATGIKFRRAHNWPSVSCARVLANWERARSDVFVPYFRARAAHATMQPPPGESSVAPNALNMDENPLPSSP